MITIVLCVFVALLIFWKTNSRRKLTGAIGYLILGLSIGTIASFSLGAFYLPSQVRVSDLPNCWVTDGIPNQASEKDVRDLIYNARVANKNLNPYDLPVYQYDLYFDPLVGDKTYILSNYRFDRRLFWVGNPSLPAEYHYHEQLFLNDFCKNDDQVTTIESGVELQYIEPVEQDEQKRTQKETEVALEFLRHYSYSFPAHIRIVVGSDDDIALEWAGYRFIQDWGGLVLWDRTAAITYGDSHKSVILFRRDIFEERGQSQRIGDLVHELLHTSQVNSGCVFRDSLTSPCENIKFLLEGEAHILGKIAERGWTGQMIYDDRPITTILSDPYYMDWIEGQAINQKYSKKYPVENLRVEQIAFTAFLLNHSPGGLQKGLESILDLRLLLSAGELSEAEAFEQAFGWNLEEAYSFYQDWKSGLTDK